jgi:predicted ATP-binding protein involved in virulence
MLKNFKIDKLFGFRDVNINFNDDIKILIGENGLGKTTILNSLYYVLNKMYAKLLKVDFENIELTFKDNSKIAFSKNELETYVEYQNNKLRHGRVPISIRKIIDNINYKDFKRLFKKSQQRLLPQDRENFNKFIIKNDIPRFAS